MFSDSQEQEENGATSVCLMDSLKAWGNRSRLWSCANHTKWKKICNPIFPVHLSACFCPSLKPLQVRQFLAPCLQHKRWSFELSKPRSGFLPITCCTLMSRSPKNPKGIFIMAFLRPFFSSTHRHIQSHATHTNLLVICSYKYSASSLLQHPRLTLETWKERKSSA